MFKNIQKVGVFLLVINLMACQSEHLEVYPELNDERQLTKTLSPKEMREDIRYLFNRLAALHPNLDARISQASRAALEAHLLASVSQSMSRRTFYRVIGRATSHIQDGHAGVLYPYQEYNRFTATGGRIFPLIVKRTNGGLYIQQDLRNQHALAPGTRILAINGRDSAELLRDMADYARGEKPQLREEIVVEDFAAWLWHLDGIRDSYTIDVQDQHGVRQVEVKAISPASFKADSSDTTQADVYYRTRPDQVGYLDVAYFGGDEDQFEHVLNKSVQQAKNDNVKLMLIDLRRNPGGSTDQVERLLARITDRRCRLVSVVQERLNDRNRGVFSYKGKLGTLRETKMHEWVNPLPLQDRFPGKIFVLVGPYTYSAAIVMATAVQDCGVGKLVGEETAGFANQTGQIYFFNLPNSGLRAFSPTRAFIRPNGNLSLRGVVPDHVVTMTPKALSDGRDEVIEQAVQIGVSEMD